MNTPINETVNHLRVWKALYTVQQMYGLEFVYVRREHGKWIIRLEDGRRFAIADREFIDYAGNDYVDIIYTKYSIIKEMDIATPH